MNHVTLTTNEINPLPRVETKRIRPVGNWKKWIAVLSLCIICLTYLVPSLMTTAGSAWIDDSRLQALKDSSSGYIPIEEMPEHLWKAFVAIEDHRFMQHGGVDPAALARAVWIDLQEGAYVQGGSTITMQLARNLFLTQDKTMWRKMKEMAIAMELERRYTKQEILEMYLNVIYFGHGQYGIGNAAQFYFGKGNSQAIDTLTVGESAILASLPKAPEAYSPVKHSEKAMARQHLVLERMTELKILSQQEKEKALAEKIQVRQP